MLVPYLVPNSLLLEPHEKQLQFYVHFQRPSLPVGTLGKDRFDFAKAEETGEWDVEWDGVPPPSFRSHAVLTPINKWYKFGCTPEAIKVLCIHLIYMNLTENAFFNILLNFCKLTSL